jgi:hydroxypyruvate reductase
MKPRLIIAFPISGDVIQTAQDEFETLYSDVAPLTAAELVQLANQHRVEAILVSPFHRIDAELIGKLPTSVKIIATCSVGYEHLDLSAAKVRKIMMTNTPDVLTDATADLAIMLMLGASRRLREQVSVVEQGWGRSLGQNEFLGLDVTGKTVGIIGMGRIGQAFAQRARGFNMKILYSNRNRLAPELEKGATFYADYRAMLPHCQVLSLHAPATSETLNMIDAQAFALLPEKAIFINVARGGLVDQEALISSLQSGKPGRLFAAGLDVFKNEPNIDPRFLKLKNVLLTPHTGSATIETRNAMGFRALENIRLAIAGKSPRDLLEMS